ncbi:MAG TPA: glycogen synthase GlgA [Candidatus Omnitrophota bacterium]|nr:glycogen synthase GlgA [Candidatus Omnitrophota bacterium]HRZ14966.1 glycogen synthase GlgA [Candidatus Omnitrophota bacterium]
MKIVMCASEVVPFAKTGGLADVAGALPVALEKLQQDVIIVMPGYKKTHELKSPAIKQLKEGVSWAQIGKGIKVYLIDRKDYFDRDGLYGDKTGDFPDNLDRFSFFCRRTLELLKEIDFKPDIIHCHDWQSGLVPVYLKTTYKNDPFFKNTRTIFTIHNIGYQGLFKKEEFPRLGLDWSVFSVDKLEYYDKINILKGGIVFSDLINTVSDAYSREIQTKEFGFGMEGILNQRKADVSGIINGLDYGIWDPALDKQIFNQFSVKEIEGKYENKSGLQKMVGLPEKRTVPLFGIVSRLAEQKGFDILAEGIDEICKMDLQLVILGTGDAKYHELLEKMVKKYPKVISLSLKFDDALAHRIYAGSDIFLMPSKYEPCGLGQMISLKYGTIPLVFKTGGLADTVNEKNGFVFDVYSKAELIKTIKKAISAFKAKAGWSKLVTAAMKCNFSWAESAKKYVELYGKAKAKS